MAHAVSNRLLPILVGVVVLMFALVTLRTCTGPDGNEVVLESVPVAPRPDADSPADTIKTLTANVAAMSNDVQALHRDNAQLRSENQALMASRAQIEENVAIRLRRELLAQQNSSDNRTRIDAGVLASLTDRVDLLADSLARSQTGSAGSDIPVGLGLDGIGAPAPAVLWVEPLDAPGPMVSDDGLLNRTSQRSTGYLADTGRGAREVFTRTQSQLASLPDRPVYTVPRNATLIASTAMTALVGRVPIQGQVRDPMPFKVITGGENLAANGLTIPGVQGMVWSGTAVGDWTLSCVTGRLDSVTFVFDDGTIRTISSDAQSGQGGNEEPLGWISDAQGIPCIGGERRTNAAAFLTQRIGVQAIQAAADAAAAAQTTSVVGNAGTVTNSLTGNVGEFVLGKTVAGGSEEVARWLLERQSQSFDAVFVPAGTAVAIHVDRELAIDFEHNGRRLHHDAPTDFDRPHRLD